MKNGILFELFFTTKLVKMEFKQLLKMPLLALLALGLVMVSCKKDDDTSTDDLDQELEAVLLNASGGQGLSFFVLPESDDFASIPQDPNNPLTTAKVALGKLLYHETGMGLSPMHAESEGTFSCASCHFASAGFQAGRLQGISDGGIGFGVNGEGRQPNPNYMEAELDVQPIRSPTALNVAYQEVMLWNGQFGAKGLNAGTESQWTAGTPKEKNFLGYEGVETQAIAAQDVHRLEIPMDFLEQTGYKAMFDLAYPNIPANERYTKEYSGLAIAAYERTLLANQAPWQRWLRGEQNAMTDQEKRGAILFFEKGECGTCHTGPALNTMEFYAIGMNDLHLCPEPVFKTDETSAERKGRASFTGKAEDEYKFKVPQLYNLKDSPFYGHGSTFRSIKSVVEYKNEGVSENADVPASQLAAEFKPLGLSNEEVDAITAFIQNALHDPDLGRFEPDAILSGNCFPFNDPIARVELGCE